MRGTSEFPLACVALVKFHRIFCTWQHARFTPDIVLNQIHSRQTGWIIIFKSEVGNLLCSSLSGTERRTKS